MTDWFGGLSPDRDLVLPARPDDPEMRESASLWLFEKDGAFAFPRIGIEAEGHSWDDRLYHANFAFPGGRILHDSGRGPVPPAVGEDGRATVLGAGPLVFRCVEPFRRWRVTFDGGAIEGTADEQIAGGFGGGARVPLRFSAELAMETPAWVQDNTPQAVARMSPARAIEAGNMGIGYRIEQLFRASGELTVGGATRAFESTGSRIHRQSVRPMGGFRGHCWQSALFPDGRAFGYIAYPPREDGTPAYNEGYVYLDGRMYPARAIKAPWLRRLAVEGDDASLELESELGVIRIEAATMLSTFRPNNPHMGGLSLQQAGCRYVWDDQVAYGMIERSSPIRP